MGKLAVRWRFFIRAEIGYRGRLRLFFQVAEPKQKRKQ